MRAMVVAAFLAVLLGTAALTGCEFYRVVTFKGDDITSYKKAHSMATLFVTHDASCGAEEQKVIAPVIASAAVGIALNLIEGEIKGYIDKEKEKFTTTYSASASGPMAYIKNPLVGDSLTPAFNCIRFLRYVTEQEEKEKGEKADRQILAFEIYIQIETEPGGQAQRLVPRSVSLQRAAALTDRESRKIDTSVEIKIDAIAGGEKGVEKVAVADQILKFADLQTPGGTNGVPNKGKTIYDCEAATPASQQAKQCRSFARSSWFPSIPETSKDLKRCTGDAGCKGITPFTVSALATETGSGGDDFGKLSKDIDDNKKTLNDAITSAVKDALTTTSKK